MIKHRLILPWLALMISMLACGLRAGSTYEATEIAKGIAEGIPTGRAQLAHEQTATAEAGIRLTLAPSPTCKPGAFGCARATAEGAVQQILGTPTPAPPLPPLLFTVITRGNADSTQNYLYNQAGVPDRLGLGTGLVQLVAKLVGGVELPVHETYLANEYYMVVVDVWVERLDLVNLGNGAFDQFRCAWHDERHVSDPITKNPQVLCHAHLYDTNVIDEENVIGLAERDAVVEVLKVDEQARMAYVRLSRLWIDASLVDQNSAN